MSIKNLVSDAQKADADRMQILINICQEIIAELKRIDNVIELVNFWDEKQRTELMNTIAALIKDLRSLKRLPIDKKAKISYFDTVMSEADILINNLTAFITKIERTDFKNAKAAQGYYYHYIEDPFEESLLKLIKNVKALSSH
ncbi:hypothetical protein KY325_03310 [Candidatus Woesearchaeota archaeon]|nr:hypothetical protein [Candidatus Woesearchaeota archaeon]MBW3018161.1 hypothetical protein [Candidatus Woesearchaeota archaeon]